MALRCAAMLVSRVWAFCRLGPALVTVEEYTLAPSTSLHLIMSASCLVFFSRLAGALCASGSPPMPLQRPVPEIAASKL